MGVDVDKYPHYSAERLLRDQRGSLLQIPELPFAVDSSEALNSELVSTLPLHWSRALFLAKHSRQTPLAPGIFIRIS